MAITTTIGVFGGTFDPIHFGHLRAALEVFQRLDIKPIKFIPAKQQVLKVSKPADVHHRLAMLELALAGMPMFEIETLELTSDQPSYMIHTLEALSSRHPNTILNIILGSDSFATFSQWHRYTDITRLANVIVINRRCEVYLKSNDCGLKMVTDKKDLFKRVGQLFLLDLPTLDISATAIREQIREKLSPKYLLPGGVLAYIQQHHLYE